MWLIEIYVSVGLTGLCLMWLIEVGFSGGNTNRSMFNMVNGGMFQWS